MNLKRKISLAIGSVCGLITLYLLTWGVSNAASPPATLSAAAISSPTTISSSSDDATRPAIAVGSGNTLYVAWEQAGGTGGSKDIFGRSFDGASWTPSPAAVYNSTTTSLRPAMATDANGDVHIVWREEIGTTSVYTTTYQKGLTPTTPITVSPVITLTTAHDIVVDGGNVVHLALQGNKTGATTPYNILHSQKPPAAASWPQATTVYTGSGGLFGAQYPSITADGQGNLHLAWQENTTTDSVLYYTKGITSGGTISWMAAAPVPTSSVVITDATRPSIAIDGNDALHLVWEDHVADAEQYIYYIRSTGNVTQATSTTWSAPSRIMSQAAKANNISPSFVSPVVAVSGNTIYVAWHDSTGDTNDLEDIYYSYSTDGGTTWATPVNVSNSDGVQSLFPQIAVDGQSAVHFVWQEKVSGKWEVRYAGTQRAVFLPVVLKNS